MDVCSGKRKQQITTGPANISRDAQIIEKPYHTAARRLDPHPGIRSGANGTTGAHQGQDPRLHDRWLLAVAN